jgi:GntR family transcriptional regulator
MQITLDFRSGQPIYIQIMDQIRQMVENGELQRGDQLPTVRQLATELRVNWNTVARAYRLLDEAGLISTQRGRGTYIWDTPSAEIIRRLQKQGLDGLTHHFLAQVARQGFSPDEVASIFEQHLAEWKKGLQPQESIAEQ